jgi:transketolase
MDSDDKKKIIKNIIDIAYVKREGHIASSLSILDILYVLYKNFIDKNNKFVLSKGHASLGLYSILNHFKLLEYNIESFGDFDSGLGGHPSNRIAHVECATGSLGHGFPFALGMAMSKKIKKESGKIFVIIGDGESNEGTIWETALLASHHKLDNLCCILDHNHSTDRALNMGNLLTKFESFGWDVDEVDGHNQEDLILKLSKKTNMPQFILANTIKGRGVEMMENNPEWHHKFPNEEEYCKIMEEIK